MQWQRCKGWGNYLGQSIYVWGEGVTVMAWQSMVVDTLAEVQNSGQQLGAAKAVNIWIIIMSEI